MNLKIYYLNIVMNLIKFQIKKYIMKKKKLVHGYKIKRKKLNQILIIFIKY